MLGGEPFAAFVLGGCDVVGDIAVLPNIEPAPELAGVYSGLFAQGIDNVLGLTSVVVAGEVTNENGEMRAFGRR